MRIVFDCMIAESYLIIEQVLSNKKTLILMRISKYRKSDLIDRSFRMTVISTTLTAMAPLIATLVDGLVASHVIGPDAFIAVSVTLPIVSAVGVLCMICCRGGSMLAAGQLAKGNHLKANRIFTVALSSAVIVAVAVSLGIFLRIDSISSSLSHSPECAAYVKEYLQVILIYFLVLPFNCTFNDFMTQGGNPQLTTRAVVAACIVNVILDIVFVVIFHWGIVGVGVATVIFGLINFGIQLPLFIKGKSLFRLANTQGDLGGILWDNLKHGFGFNIFYIVVNGFMLLGNALVLRVAGGEGLTVFDVCLQIQSATFSLMVGICIAGIAHVSYMRIIGDNDGLRRILANSCIITMVFYGTLALLMVAFPGVFLTFFGVSDTVSIAMARRVFFCYGIYYFCFCVVAVYVTVVLQLAGHLGAKIILVFSLGVLAYLGMLGLSFVSPDAMWYGLIISGVPILLASFGFGYWQHIKHPEYTQLTLVDKYPNQVKFECSLDYECRHIEDFKHAIRVFSDACEMSEKVYSNLCLTSEKLYNDALEHKPKHLKYMDFTVCEGDDFFQMTIKNCGKPNNPVAHGIIDADSCGAISTDYRFMFGMNVISVKWAKN